MHFSYHRQADEQGAITEATITTEDDRIGGNMSENQYRASRCKGTDLCWVDRCWEDGRGAQNVFAINVVDIPDMILALEGVLDEAGHGSINADYLPPTNATQRLAELESSHAILREQVRELTGEVEKLWGECGYKHDNVRGSRKYCGTSGIEYVVPDGRYPLGEFKCPCCGRPAMILQDSVTIRE